MSTTMIVDPLEPEGAAPFVTRGDNPIRSGAEDLLGRGRAAQSIARLLRTADVSEGFVVGLLGPWGSGKTSLINLVREELKLASALAVVEFNPWMFSGTEQLAESFFNEIGAQLRTESPRFAAIADDLQQYGEVLAPLRFLPVIGPWIERFRGGAGAIKRLVDARRGGVTDLRARVAKRLAGLERPIVVVVDDVDRLYVDEIRDMFKLVRLTANFPNLIYVVAFDRGRVERALSEQGLDGRDYLDKILQATFDIPVLPDGVLVGQLTRALDASLEDVEEPGPFSTAAWADVLAEIVFPLVRHMRDVRRYVAAVRSTVVDIHGQVALVDVLALEAVRIFLPDTYALIGTSVAGLTTTSSSAYGGTSESPVLKQQVEAIVASGPSDITTALIVRLFPGAQRHIQNNHYGSEWLKSWLRKRRVAHPDVLRLYLERTESDAIVAFTAAERAYSLMGDAGALDAFLETLELDSLEDVIGGLEAYEDEYPVETVVPAATVLLRWIGRLPDKPRGMFSFEARLTVTRVVLRLLRRWETPDAIEQATNEILPALPSLSSRLELINIVGHEEHVGHKLIDPEAAATMARELRDAVRGAEPRELAQEWGLARLVMWTKRTSDPSEPPMPSLDDLTLLGALLRGCLTEVRSQGLGSRAVHRESRLVWDGLIEIIGDEAVLAAAVDDFAASDDSKLAEAAELAKRYLGGWRPEGF